MIQTFEVGRDGPHEYIRCLRCERRSFHIDDIRWHYCAKCHVFHDDLPSAVREWWLAEKEANGDRIEETDRGNRMKTKSKPPQCRIEIMAAVQPKLTAAIAAWQKIAKASAAGRGVRLSAEEVKRLWED